MLKKATEIHKMIRKIGSRAHIEIDGGITRDNVCEAAAAGVNVIVAGTAVFRAASVGDISHLWAAGAEPSFAGRFCTNYGNGQRID